MKKSIEGCMISKDEARRAKNGEELFAMQRIIFATGNAGKMKEIRMILSDLEADREPVEILSMKEAGIELDIEENGKSFEENAVIKAKAVAAAAEGAVVLADDSGL